MTSGTEIRDAANLAPLVSGGRLRLARESHGWTQRELTDRMADSGHRITPAAVSQLERGNSAPTGRTLATIADATGFPLDYFVSRPQDGELPGFFRSLRSTPAYARKRALARAHMVHDLLAAIAHYVELPDLDRPIIRPDANIADEGRAIEAAAGRLRRHWGLGHGPIDNMVLELERHGIVVCRLSLGSHDVDAFSVPFKDRPIVVLSEDKAAYTRSRFDAAHELAHLVLGHGVSDVGEKAAEAQAHRFAAAFLMPADAIREDLPSTADWRKLIRLKGHWRVSIGALLMRARTLGVMTDARYTSAMKYMSARGWRTDEPGERELGAPEQPRLLSMAMDHLRIEEDITVEDLAAEAGLPADQVALLLGDSTAARAGLARPRLRL